MALFLPIFLLWLALILIGVMDNTLFGVMIGITFFAVIVVALTT